MRPVSLNVGKSDAARGLFLSAARFLTGTCFSRFTGLARDVATAWAFGAHPSVASLLFAFRLSHLFRRLLGEGALHGVFIPHYGRLLGRSPAEAAELFISLSITLSYLLLLLIGSAMLSLGYSWMAGGLTQADQELCSLTFFLMPGLFFICLYGLSAALLQAHHSFFLPSVAPALLNIGWIGAIAYLYRWEAAEAMPWLALAIVVATCLQWLVTLPRVLRLLACSGVGFSWRQLLPGSYCLMPLLVPLLLNMGGVMATQLNSSLDLFFARVADPSGPAYLWYAIRLQQLPLALFGLSLASALLPSLAQTVVRGEEESFCHLLKRALAVAFVFALVATCLLYGLGQWSIALIYGHGDFDKKALGETTGCLFGYGVGLMPMALLSVVVAAYQSLGDYRTPMWASCMAVLSNLLLNSLFVFGYGWGSASIALATGLSSWLQLVLLALGLVLRGKEDGIISRIKRSNHSLCNLGDKESSSLV